MAPKAPQARGFTLAERRSIAFEKVTLYVVLLVAVIAAIVSFMALTWVGQKMGMQIVSPLLPAAVDGFAIACSVGIVRSQASGEHARERLSEWAGLFLALSLSIAGNVQHALVEGSPDLPRFMLVGFSAAIPVIVAYGIHVYGRSLARGISAHVLVDDPDKLHFDVTHLGDEQTVAAAKAPLAPRVSRPRTAEPTPTSTPTPAPAAAPAAVAQRPQVVDDEKARARALFDEAIAADPTTKPDASRIHDAAGVSGHKATTRRWVQTWWDEVGPEVAEAAAVADEDAVRDLAMGGREGRDRMVG